MRPQGAAASRRSVRRFSVRRALAFLHAVAAALLDEHLALVGADRALAAVAVLVAALVLADMGVRVAVQLAVAVRGRRRAGAGGERRARGRERIESDRGRAGGARRRY